jgi:hypothetical protein
LQPRRRDVEEPASPLEPDAGVHAEQPAAEGADDITRDPRHRHHAEGGGVIVDPMPERDHVRVRKDAGGKRARVEHRQLAGRRENRGDDHQPEDGIDAVVADEGGDRAGDAGNRHRPRLAEAPASPQRARSETVRWTAGPGGARTAFERHRKRRLSANGRR